MKYYQRFVLTHDASQSYRVFDVANCADYFNRWKVLPEFLFEPVEREFIELEENDTTGFEACDLPAQFGADRSTRTGDHHVPAAKQRVQALAVEFHRIAAQQVVEFDASDL